MDAQRAAKQDLDSSKPLTIQAIADKLGIHKSTVSLVLSGKGRISTATRDRIMALVQEHGYAPDPFAQRLASRSRHKIVYLCTGALDPGLGTEKTALLQSYLTGLGLDVPISTPAKSHDGDQHSVQSQIELFRNLRRLRPQAIVCSVHTFHEDAFVELENYQREGGIVVSYDLPIPLACDQVIFDRVENAYQGAKYLLEQGHRYLGLGISRRSSAQNSNLNTTQNQRLDGFRRALAEYSDAREWIVENARYEEGGASMASEFLSLKERPTGLCIVNDYVALSFMVETMRAGVHIPQEVSIIGHEDQRVASYCPVPLTSVSQPLNKIVQAVGNLLLARLQGDTQPPQTVMIHGDLIVRDSVASVPGT
jgi:DNA-binding LacI/PurR family transcriptional regulator